MTRVNYMLGFGCFLGRDLGTFSELAKLLRLSPSIFLRVSGSILKAACQLYLVVFDGLLS